MIENHPLNIILDFSFIIPIKNAERTIIRCISSISKITIITYEVIVICNNCTDNTVDLLNKYKFLNDKINIKIVVNNNIKNASAARNIGIKMACGKYISFVDSDDYLIVDGFQKFLNLAKDPKENQLIIGSYTILNIKGSALRKHGLEKSMILDLKLIQNYLKSFCMSPYIYTLFVHCWGKIYSSETVKNNNIQFDEELDQLEDVNFNLNYLKFCEKVHFIDIPIYFYDTEVNSYSLSTRSGVEYKPIQKIFKALNPLRSLLKRTQTASHTKILISQIITSISRIWIIRLSKNIKLNKKNAAIKIIEILKSREYKVLQRNYICNHNDSRILDILSKYTSPNFVAYYLIRKSGR
jgi:glycosyltransferase involved in cell wall biosynthesis